MTAVLDSTVDVEPNVLTFEKIKPGAPKDTFVHYWVLKDPENEIIADSSFYFESKELAMENCVEVFGTALALGQHIVKGKADEELLKKALSE
ncbi:hypothetical protein SEA_ODESZA_68 [Gordonia Phage Odesza]|uniref:Uncharacterized protein n=4 Tax=Tanisvirus tanis TaxID=2844677 RepID=A0A7D5G3S5_9CAUD|nr:hypothetical protein PBI_GRAVY_68 [Gordonia phage Gravy]AVO25401.1 hypothetical protein PBI_KERRY_68 [Gordonia phage Kerry]QGJ89679.1 hypothetical protein SEA_ODESZA_68 [Gordonia Phage Odesza]QKY78740.1 hypothetical protein SEA_GILL_69 [Gordonia phage Gill]QLF83786.1 hypothetical protein SEA_MAGEL_70 [Gordonia phage Magel]QYW00708.1 hypothetical protein SEA_RONEY_69 [Gordonia phage Roney]